MISRLDLKLVRDLNALKTQALAVALVMACGLAMMIMTRSLIQSLDQAREQYYRDNRFGDGFVSLKRAPKQVAERIAAMPGVVAVEPSLRFSVAIDVPGLLEPASALVNSLPDRGPPRLHVPHLRAGRMLAGDGRDEVLVGEAFAEAHGMRPGDRLAAILDGRKVELQVVGIVLSPQFVFEARPGSALPDNRTFAVLWMREKALAEAFNYDGAFNELAYTLAPGASERGVIAEVDRLLEPYGGLGAYGRADHPSDIRVSDEIGVLRGLSFGFPLVFLSVAAFMTNAVMSRQITLQREQIAILKAFGFGNRAIGWHYVKFTLVIVVTGTLLGAVGGFLLGGQLVGMYHKFFRFPALDFLPAWGAIGAAMGASAVAAFAGVLGAVRRVARLAPAEAMRPEPPASFRPALFERWGATRGWPVALRMALRNLERKPWQALLTSAALALATGIMIIPNAFRDGVNHVLDFQWDGVQRQTVTVGFNQARSPRALADLWGLPGVMQAEPFLGVAVELRVGVKSRRVAVSGLPRGGELQRVMDAKGRVVALPANGLVVSAVLAEALGIGPGEEVEMRVLQGNRTRRTVRVTGLAEDFSGMAAYMELEGLNRLLGEGDRIGGASLVVAGGEWEAFLEAIKNTPVTAGVAIKESLRRSFRETTAESIGLIQTIYLTFAVVVAFGIVYNSARISLSERQRELATLRVLGFGRRQVGAVLVGELVILTVLAIPLGLVFGSGMAKLILLSVNTETVRLPLILSLQNYAFAVLVMGVATATSLTLACRKLGRLDLVGALKAAD